MDMSKLTPAPWEAIYYGPEVAKSPGWGVDCNLPDVIGVATVHRGYGNPGEEEANARFIALARNAFEVQMRRGWHAERCDNGLWVIPGFDYMDAPAWAWPDPFTALVEADAWLTTNPDRR